MCIQLEVSIFFGGGGEGKYCICHRQTKKKAPKFKKLLMKGCASNVGADPDRYLNTDA